MAPVSTSLILSSARTSASTSPSATSSSVQANASTSPGTNTIISSPAPSFATALGGAEGHSSEALGITPVWNPMVVLVFFYIVLFLGLTASAVFMLVRARQREAREREVRHIADARAERARGKAASALADAEKGVGRESGSSDADDVEEGREQDLGESMSAADEVDKAKPSPPPPVMPLGLPVSASMPNPGQEAQTSPAARVLVWLPSFRSGGL